MSWQNISGNDMRPTWVSSLTDQAGLPFWLMGTILLRAPISASDFWDAEDMMRGGRENDGEKKKMCTTFKYWILSGFFLFLVTSALLSAECKFLWWWCGSATQVTGEDTTTGGIRGKKYIECKAIGELENTELCNASSELWATPTGRKTNRAAKYSWILAARRNSWGSSDTDLPSHEQHGERCSGTTIYYLL